MNLTLKEVLGFRRMLTPFLVKLVFWGGLIVCWGIGLLDLLQSKYLQGVLLFILGTLFLRIFCELLLLFFQINNTLLDVLKELKLKNLLEIK